MWGDKNRKTWLTQGDLNTRLFHNCMKQKIASNTILKMRNDFDQWIYEQDEISNLLIKSFTERFQSENTQTHTLDLSFVRKFVTQEDSLLLEPISRDGIKKCIL